MPDVPDLWHTLDREPDRVGRLPRREDAVVSEPAGHALGERWALTLDLGLPDGEGALGVRLLRNQRPDEGLEEAQVDVVLCLRAPLLGLVLLIGGEVELGLVRQDV